MGRRFITAHDIDDLVAGGSLELRLDAATRLTDLARERARDRGVTLVEVTGQTDRPGPAATPRSAPAPEAPPHTPPEPRFEQRPGASTAPGSQGTRPASPDGQATSTGEGHPPRRQLRAAVRAGVVEEFGTTPPDLDAAIGRVFDRLGIRD